MVLSKSYHIVCHCYNIVCHCMSLLDWGISQMLCLRRRGAAARAGTDVPGPPRAAAASLHRHPHAGTPRGYPALPPRHVRCCPPGGLALRSCIVTVLAPLMCRIAGRHRCAGPAAGGGRFAPPSNPSLIAKGLLPRHVRCCPPGGLVLSTCFATVLAPSRRCRAGRY